MNFIKFYQLQRTGLFQALTYLWHLFILSPQSSPILLSNNSYMSKSLFSQKEITAMLRSWSEGEREASEELIRVVYKELRRQARYQLQRERANHTLQTTALINEAYLKLIEQRSVKWESRTHFFALAAEMMRRILVDYAKTRYRQKRGGKEENLPLEAALMVRTDEQELDFIALDEALTRLSKIDNQQARIVELRYFSGLSVEETAEVLGISRATVHRDWAMAKAWLYQELTRKGGV
jgi:RNA polymerase sigma factor (TIGR02999 family)